MNPASIADWLNFYSLHLKQFRKVNDRQAQAVCPFHEDRQPSLSVNIVAGLWQCHGCGLSGNALDFAGRIGVSRESIPGWEVQSSKSEITDVYDYRDEGGNLLFQTVRMVPKTFRQRVPDGPNQWRWGLTATRRVLYKLPEILKAKSTDGTIFIAEGEKDVETMWAQGFVATCNPMGAGKWRPEYGESLRGFLEAIILSDKDEPGRKHAQQVAASIAKAVGRVKVLELPGHGVKDSSDWFGAGGTAKDLMALVQVAPLWTASEESFHVSAPIGEKQETIRMTAIPVGDFMLSGAPEVAWRVEGILPTDGAAILAGTSGYGKSWLLLDLAVECARGGRWLGHFSTTKGPVLFVDEESTDRLIRKRMTKLLAAKGIEAKQLDIRFLVGAGFCLTDPKSVREFRRLLDRERPALIIIDTLIRVFRGEENSASDMAVAFAPVKAIIRDYDCAVIFADHQRKLSGIAGVPGDQILRGSSEKTAFVDTLLSLHKRDDLLVVEHSKSRYAEPIPSFAIRIQDNPQKTETRVEYVGEAEPLKQAAKLQPAFEFLAQHASGNTNGFYRKDLVSAAREVGISEKLLDEALKSWVTDGRLEVERRREGQGAPKSYYRPTGQATPAESFHVSDPIYTKRETIPATPADLVLPATSGLNPSISKVLAAFDGAVRP